MVTANRHFYVATFFLWYPNLIICYLNMYFRMIWTFAFGKCYNREALRFLVVLILIGTRAVLITRFPLALIFSCAGFPTFSYFWILLMVSACLM